MKRDFWSFVEKAGEDECWPWRGATVPGGYGRWRRGDGGLILAHRHSLELSLCRSLRDGEYSCHRCDNPPCCNPAHLFAGSAKDNARDCADKGRNARVGKLSVALAAEIRGLRGSQSARMVAAKYGITPRHVYNVWKSVSWLPSSDPSNRSDALVWCAGGCDR